jgi:hypothetical protein
VEVLNDRQERLHDALDAISDHRDARQLLDALTWVLSDITNSGSGDPAASRVSPEIVDDVVKRSDLVNLTLAANSWLEDAPEPPTVQLWTTSSGHAQSVTAPKAPTPERMRSVVDLSDGELLRRPLPGGLFTSSALAGAPSMWNRFMLRNSQQNEDANLWRRPWRTWAVRPSPSCRMIRVRSARDWAALLEDEPLVGADGLLNVNWRRLSEEFDAAHFSVRAVCSIDGLSLRCRGGWSSPITLTTESTIWLRWHFDAVEEIATRFE